MTKEWKLKKKKWDLKKLKELAQKVYDDEKEITAEERLKAISILVESDEGFEADTYSMRKDKDPEAKMFAELIMKVYRVVHPHYGCSHHNWDRDTKKLLT